MVGRPGVTGHGDDDGRAAGAGARAGASGGAGGWRHGGFFWNADNVVSFV